MAIARMLHRSIAIDARFNELSIKEQWLFMRLLPFADDEGKLTGNLTELRALTLPLAPIRNGEMEKMLSKITTTGLINWNKDVVIQYTGWGKNQKIGHRPKTSVYPDYVKEKNGGVLYEIRKKRAKKEKTES